MPNDDRKGWDVADLATQPEELKRVTLLLAADRAGLVRYEGILPARSDANPAEWPLYVVRFGEPPREERLLPSEVLPWLRGYATAKDSAHLIRYREGLGRS